VYGLFGAGLNLSQAIFLDIPPEQKIMLGMGIQSFANLIEPAKIIGKHYLSKRKQRQIESGPGSEERGLVGRFAGGAKDRIRNLFTPQINSEMIEEYSFKVDSELDEVLGKLNAKYLESGGEEK
jgi:hypothetical protein